MLWRNSSCDVLLQRGREFIPIHFIFHAFVPGSLARSLTLEILQNQPVNTWLEAESLLEMIQNRDENFSFAYRSDVEKRGHGSNYDGHGIYYYGSREDFLRKLEEYEEQFVRRVIGTSLFKLGLVELGFQTEAAAANNQWSAFRLTPLAAAAFGQPVPPSATPTDGLRPHLQPFATQDRALAVVAEKSLPQVKKILTQLGISVAQTLKR